MDIVICGDCVWSKCLAGIHLAGRGNPHLLEAPLTAFFASRQSPGFAIRAGMDWALRRGRDRRPVISGFHSPLERSVLELLLEAGSPVVAVLARSVESARVPVGWKHAIEHGHLTIVSVMDGLPQLTERRAAVRNDLAAQLAVRIDIAHASPDGALQTQINDWDSRGIRVNFLPEP